MSENQSIGEKLLMKVINMEQYLNYLLRKRKKHESKSKLKEKITHESNKYGAIPELSTMKPQKT